jgi:predicted nucleotidyltransferase
VKAFYLDKEAVLQRLREISGEAFAVFPGLTEIRLFGSLAKGEHTGLSDVDILVVAESEQKNPLEMVRPYFSFFSDRMDVAVDLIVTTRADMEKFSELLKNSICVKAR